MTASNAATAIQWQGNTLLLTCHLQPKAKSDEFCGLHGDSLKIRITAPPIDGKANLHLLKFLAKSFGVRQNQVMLVSGETSRHKRIAIENPTQFPKIPNITISTKTD